MITEFDPDITLVIHYDTGDSSRVGVVLGVRFATAISPNRTTWTHNGRTVFGGPDVGPVGGMLRLSVGIGGFKMAKK